MVRKAGVRDLDRMCVCVRERLIATLGRPTLTTGEVVRWWMLVTRAASEK